MQVTYFMRSGLAAASFRTTIDDGSGAREFRSAELVASASQGATPVLDTRRRGEMRVAFALEAEGGVASQGEVSVPVRLAERHRRAPADSVWVVWDGNEIRHPVIY